MARLNLDSLKSRPPTMALIPPVALSIATSAPLRARILLQTDPRRAVGAERKNLYVADVAGFEHVLNLLLRPGHVGLAEGGGIAAKLEGGDPGAGAVTSAWM